MRRKSNRSVRERTVTGTFSISVVAKMNFHMLGRLFERLQQRIEGRLRQHVNFVDDIDLHPRRGRPVARRFDDLAHVVDAGVRCGVHLDHINMPRLDDSFAMHAIVGHGDRRHGDRGRVALRRFLVVQRARKDSRRRRLADAAHASQQIGLVDAPEREGIRQDANHHILPDQLGEAFRPVFARKDAIGRGGVHRRAGRSGQVGEKHIARKGLGLARIVGHAVQAGPVAGDE